MGPNNRNTRKIRVAYLSFAPAFSLCDLRISYWMPSSSVSLVIKKLEYVRLKRWLTSHEWEAKPLGDLPLGRETVADHEQHILFFRL